jgi:hypothetical protein
MRCDVDGHPYAFEPVGRTQGNDEFKVAAGKMMESILAPWNMLKTKKSDW